MLANFDGTCTEHQPNKNKEGINNRNNKENTSNIEQISERRAMEEQTMDWLSS